MTACWRAFPVVAALVGTVACGTRAYLPSDARKLEFRPVEAGPAARAKGDGEKFPDPWWSPETLVAKPAAFGGEDLEAIVVKPARRESTQREITLYVRKDSWDRVLDATVPLVGKRLGIVVDGTLAAAPVLREPVFGTVDLALPESALDALLLDLPRGRPPGHPAREYTDWLEHRLALRGYDRTAAWRLADTYAQSGRCDKAIPLQETMVQKERDPTLVLGRLGRCYRALGRNADAIGIYERLLSSGPPPLEWLVRLELAKSYEAEGDVGKAIAELERSLALVQDAGRSRVFPETQRETIVGELREEVEKLPEARDPVNRLRGVP